MSSPGHDPATDRFAHLVLSQAERRVLEYLDGSFSRPKSGEICEALGVGVHPMRMMLSDLSRRRLVVRSRSGRYRLAEDIFSL